MTSERRGRLDESTLRSGLLGPRSVYRHLVVSEQTGSTNADAAEAARSGAPGGSVFTTEHQLSGRGRLDRTFTIPAGGGIAVSVVFRPEGVSGARWMWLPLLVGLALDDTLREVGVTGALKWPNDVLIDGRKVSGISLERVETPTGPAAVIGVGVNVSLREDELPVPTATSLLLAGADDLDRTSLLVRFLARLETRYRRWSVPQSDGDRGLREDYTDRCDTVGRLVDVSMPDGSVLHGTAEDIDELGRLVVAGTAVSAGDVTHVRPAGSLP